jgi:hypothetical protein
MLSSYVWPAGHFEIKARVLTAIVCLVGGKLASISAPFAFKNAVDSLSASAVTLPQNAAAAATKKTPTSSGTSSGTSNTMSADAHGVLDSSSSSSTTGVNVSNAVEEVSTALVNAVNTLNDPSNVALAVPIAAIVGCT